MCSAVIYKKVLGWPKASFRYGKSCMNFLAKKVVQCTVRG